MRDDLPARRDLILIMVAAAVVGAVLGLLTAPLVWTGAGWVWT